MEHPSSHERIAVWAAHAHRLARGTAAERLAARQGFVLTLDQARACGLSDADIRRFVRQGRWTAPRRGIVCVLGRDDGGLGPAVAAAALAVARTGTIVSHDSAASMFELPLLTPALRPSVTLGCGNGGARHDSNIHAAGLHPLELGQWFGIAVTRPSRTVVDVARNRGVRPGLVLADAALAARFTSARALDRAVAHASRWPGVRRARRVIELASPHVESPLESITRLLFGGSSVPLPEPQAWIETDAGSVRVDGRWVDRRVVLEVDGMLKYSTPADLRDEKRRQEALERAGYLVVRVTWDDVVRHPELTVARVRAALRRDGHRDLVPTHQIWR